MLLQTILNRLHKHKSFVYGTARWISHGESQNHRRAGPTPSQQPADLLRSAAKRVRVTTMWRNAATSSCRCGAWPCSCCTLLAGSIVPTAASRSSGCRGPGARAA